MIIPFIKFISIETPRSALIENTFDPNKYLYGRVLETYNLPATRGLPLNSNVMIRHFLDMVIEEERTGVAGFLNYELTFYLFMIEGEKEEEEEEWV